MEDLPVFYAVYKGGLVCCGVFFLLPEREYVLFREGGEEQAAGEQGVTVGCCGDAHGERKAEWVLEGLSRVGGDGV